jgi:hypothetical protein
MDGMVTFGRESLSSLSALVVIIQSKFFVIL